MADRILQILTKFYKFGGVYDSRIFLADFQRQQKFGGSGYSAATRKSTLRSENAKKMTEIRQKNNSSSAPISLCHFKRLQKYQEVIFHNWHARMYHR